MSNALHPIVEANIDEVINEYMTSPNSHADGLATLLLLLAKYNVYRQSFRAAKSIKALARKDVCPEDRAHIITILSRENPYWCWNYQSKEPPIRKRPMWLVVPGKWLASFVRRSTMMFGRLSITLDKNGFSLRPEDKDDARHLLVDLVTLKTKSSYQKHRSDYKYGIDYLIYHLTGYVED